MAATEQQITEFVTTLGNLAVNECNRRIAAGEGFILPSICIAQSALETGYGTADIMIKANAYFGIKAGGSWTGAVFVADTKEVINGEWVNTTANFRAYDSLADSVADYYSLTVGASRYADAVSYGKNKSAWKTPEETINALWSAGYATDDEYGPLIMSMVNGRGFTVYDDQITGVYSGPSTGGGSSPTITAIPSIKFNKRDMLQGKLKTSIPVRTIENDTSNNNAVALNWNNAIYFKNNADLIVKGLPEGVSLYLAYESETTAYVSTEATNSTLSVKLRRTYGFYLKRNDGGTFLLSDLPDSFEITLVSEGISDLVHIASPLAEFIKI